LRLKARTAKEVAVFEDVPNIGPAMIADFRLIGIRTPFDLKKQDPFKLYQKLCNVTKTRHDPCVLDTFMAAIDFMNGAKAQPWWRYTDLRKRQHPDI
jgi:hypothetical protein